jgi:DoxX-like family
MNLNGKVAYWIGWAMTGLIVLFMIFDGGITVIAFDFVTKGMTEFGFPVSYARPLGAVMLLCTLAYAVPQTAVLGAILLTGFLGGTIATHMPRPEPLLPHVAIALVMGAMVWAGLWLRDPRLRALVPWRRP